MAKKEKIQCEETEQASEQDMKKFGIIKLEI